MTPIRRTVALAALALLPMVSMATPISTLPHINGSLEMFGDLAPTGSPIMDLGQATGLNFLGDDFTVDHAYGDLAAGGVRQLDIGFIQDFGFKPLWPSPVAPLWSIKGFSFVMTSITILKQTSGSLWLVGNGYMTHAGFQATTATWNLQVNAVIGKFFFGSSSATVPEPATLLIFGAGLLGLAGMRRRRQRQALR
jgi:hypothetical protein